MSQKVGRGNLSVQAFGVYLACLAVLQGTLYIFLLTSSMPDWQTSNWWLFDPAMGMNSIGLFLPIPATYPPSVFSFGTLVLLFLFAFGFLLNRMPVKSYLAMNLIVTIPMLVWSCLYGMFVYSEGEGELALPGFLVLFFYSAVPFAAGFRILYVDKVGANVK